MIFSPFVLTSQRDLYDMCIMKRATMEARFRESEKRNGELRRELAARCAEQETLRAGYESLRIE
jgi:hypothetical protein